MRTHSDRNRSAQLIPFESFMPWKDPTFGHILGTDLPLSPIDIPYRKRGNHADVALPQGPGRRRPCHSSSSSIVKP